MKFKAKEIFAGYNENGILMIGLSGGTTESNVHHE